MAGDFYVLWSPFSVQIHTSPELRWSFFLADEMNKETSFYTRNILFKASEVSESGFVLFSVNPESK